MTSALRQPGARVAPLIQPYSLRNPRAKLGEVGPNCLPPLGLRPRGWKAVGADLPALRAGVRPKPPREIASSVSPRRGELSLSFLFKRIQSDK